MVVRVGRTETFKNVLNRSQVGIGGGITHRTHRSLNIQVQSAVLLLTRRKHLDLFLLLLSAVRIVISTSVQRMLMLLTLAVIFLC